MGVLSCGISWAPENTAVAAGQRVPKGRTGVHSRGISWEPGGAAVAAGQSVPVGEAGVHKCGIWRAPDRAYSDMLKWLQDEGCPERKVNLQGV